MFITRCVAEGGKVSSANGRVQFCKFMVGSCSNRSHIVNNSSSVFSQFGFDFGIQFCVTGEIFGEVGG